MKNDGKEAERAFLDYWEARGHVERIRDAKDLMGLNGGKRRIMDFAKPSDFLVSAKGVPLHYAEVKSTHGATGFAFAAIQPGQHNAALASVRRGDGQYTFYIFSYHLGKWFIMTADHYAEIVDSGRRSVKFEELPQWMK